MQSMADKAWQTAADCARRAEQTYDPTVRDLYRRMRDAGFAVANRCDFLDDAVMPGSSTGKRSSHHGLLPQMPFRDRTRRGYEHYGAASRGTRTSPPS